MKILCVLTSGLIILKLISLFSGWSLQDPLDSVFNVLIYVLLELIIFLYICYDQNKRKALIRLLLLGVALVCIIIPVYLGGPFGLMLLMFSAIPVGVLSLLIAFLHAVSPIRDMKRSGLSYIFVGLSIPASMVIAVVMGLELSLMHNNSDELTYQDDSYEVWRRNGGFVTSSDYTEIRLVKGPFRKTVYYESGDDAAELTTRQSIMRFLK